MDVKNKAKILIEIEVDGTDPYTTVVKNMELEGDSVTLSIAMLSAGFGMFNKDNPIEPQLEDKVKFQQAMATCILNGTITLQSLGEEQMDTLSRFLNILTDTNVLMLEKEVQDKLLTKNDDKDGQTGTRRSNFSNFS
jgi:hypothetical protein